MIPLWRGYLSLQSAKNVSVMERLFKPTVLGKCVRYREVILILQSGKMCPLWRDYLSLQSVGLNSLVITDTFTQTVCLNNLSIAGTFSPDCRLK